MSYSRKSNFLLERLRSFDHDMVSSLLTPVQLTLGMRIDDDQVAFPEQGVISQGVHTRSHGGLSVALIGFEGMAGVSAVLGTDRTPMSSQVLVAGRGHTIETARLRGVLAAHPAIRATMLAYAHVYVSGLAQAVLSAGRCRIDARLSRCLLMLDDRLAPATISVTHDNLAEVLGMRRPGVTDMIHRLEGDALIRSTRGVVTIRDRAGLERLAGDTYGSNEREYHELIGDLGERAAPDAANGGARIGASWASHPSRDLAEVSAI
jgi:CRP-like cAMP-binding protein